MRMNTISSNIANINTTRSPEGGPYRRKDVVFESMPDAKNFGELVTGDPADKIQRVQVTDVHSDENAVDLRYEPDHVDANAEGYVAYPKINLMEEMANMIQATRGYEANVSGDPGQQGHGHERARIGTLSTTSRGRVNSSPATLVFC